MGVRTVRAGQDDQLRPLDRRAERGGGLDPLPQGAEGERTVEKHGESGGVEKERGSAGQENAAHQNWKYRKGATCGAKNSACTVKAKPGTSSQGRVRAVSACTFGSVST